MKKLLAILLCLGLYGCAGSPKMIRLEPTPYINFEKSSPDITYVYKNSEAERAGFKSGDLILEIDGYKIEHPGWAYTKLKELADSNKIGIVKVKRDGQTFDIKFTPNKEDKHDFGLLLLTKHYTLEPGKKFLQVDSQTKDGISIGVCGLTAEGATLGSILLVIQNLSEKDAAIYPDSILILDGFNTILKIFGGEVIAADLQHKAERDLANAKATSAEVMSYAQSLPPTYKIKGGTTQFGTTSGNISGTLYSYGDYGRYSGTYSSTYTGSSYSNYKITPEPNIMGVAMQLGSMLALAAEQSRYKNRQRLAGELYIQAFEFGLIPAGTNRKGALYYEVPRSWPLQVKIKLNDNEYLLKLDKPKEKK